MSLFFKLYIIYGIYKLKSENINKRNIFFQKISVNRISSHMMIVSKAFWNLFSWERIFWINFPDTIASFYFQISPNMKLNPSKIKTLSILPKLFMCPVSKVKWFFKCIILVKPHWTCEINLESLFSQFKSLDLQSV